MSKIELSGTSGGYNISAINENFNTIEEALNNKVLYRDNPAGTSNVMNNHLDMNGFLILNSPSLGGGGGVGGGNGVDGFSSGIVYAYQRSSTLPTATPGMVVYDFTSHSVITPAENQLGGGWTKGIPEGDAPLYVTVATASNRTVTDTIQSNEWSSPVILSKNGLSALNTATVFAYQRTPTNAAPAAPSAACTYVFGTGITTGLNNGWTSTIPASFNGKYLWAISATASSLENTDSIAPGEWSQGELLAQDGLDGLNGGANGLNNATFYAYKRSANVPADNPGPVTYHFASASITTPSTDVLANEWYKTPPAGTNQMYVCVASASSAAITDDIAANEWTAPAPMGSNGLSTATIYVYQRTASATAPSKPSANVSYDFANKMVTGLTNNWTPAVPVASTGKYLWVTTATAASNNTTDTILPDEWAVPQLLSQDGTNGTNGTNGSNGSNGGRGTVSIAYAITGSTWSTTEANNALIAAGYFPAINRDIVTLYNTSANFSQTRFYDGGAWVVLTAYIDGNMLVTGTLSATKLTGGTISGVDIDIGSGNFRVYNSGGTILTNAAFLSSTRGTFDHSASPTAPSLQASTSTFSGAAFEAIVGEGRSGNNNGHGVRGKAKYTGGASISSGIVGASNGYDFYADGDGTNYGPFTGAHDALLTKLSPAVEGDIMVDIACISKTNLSNTIFHVEQSSVPKQKTAVGVLVRVGAFIEGAYPAAFIKERVEEGVRTTDSYAEAQATFDLGAVNALGEGQINVCGENGDIEAGDYIVTSSIPGKGMCQDDDVQRNYTVARARESVRFDSPNEVKQVACIYLCG